MMIFLTSLVFLCSGPVIVFACITGVSLGILLGTATVVVIVIQSIIVSIAGAILLFVLGSILILAAFAFFWVVVGYLGFSFMRNFALVLHAQHQHLRQQQPHSSSAHMRRDSTKSMEDDDFTL
ncbi:hypothetical protein BGZ98_010168 [Dissophora globulifera]|nr:hypothetical protein BGZ98_010168 [Dissophora globulifera]